jgi:hypothetical protein
VPSVSDLKTLYQAQIAPGNDEEFLRLLTEADLRLLEGCKHQWCKSRTTLTSVDNVITLPATLASILGAHLDGYPAPISLQDFEFGPEGPGEITVHGGSDVRLIDQGLNGSDLRTYKVTGTESDTLTIVGLCMKAPAVLYDPDIADSDLPDNATMETVCPDHGALKLAMYCILYEEAGDPGNSAIYMSKAIKRLDAREGNNQRGGAQPIPNIRPNGRGIRGIRTFR